MRSVSAFSSRTVFSLAFVVAIAGLSAACSDSIRMQQPLFTGSTENQRDILGSTGPNDGAASAYTQPMPQVADNGVSRSSLPPPPTSYAPPPTSYAAVDPTDDYAAPTTGAFEWSAVGGRVVTVGSTDTLDTMVAKYGVPGDQILNANQMHSAAEVRAGRIMVIPRRVPIAANRLQDDGAPVASAAPMQPPVAATPAMKPTPTAATTVMGSTYVVMSGDTLFSVARKVNMAPAELASLNGITTDTQLQLGQKLKIRAAAKSTTTAAADTTQPTVLGAPPHPLGTLTFSKDGAQLAANPPSIRMTTSAGTDGASNAQVAAAQPPAVPAVSTTPTPAATDASLGASDVDNAMDSASADGTTFRWPVRGRIISGFGTKPNGEKNDGINLAVPAGTAVKAVEAGTVIYAGNELAGYGNLALIRHADGWVSAYAHNQDLTVKRGDAVTRGEIIAHAGMTGSVTSPQVHFELRKGAKPVNPLDYLAGA